MNILVDLNKLPCARLGNSQVGYQLLPTFQMMWLKPRLARSLHQRPAWPSPAAQSCGHGATGTESGTVAFMSESRLDSESLSRWQTKLRSAGGPGRGPACRWGPSGHRITRITHRPAGGARSSDHWPGIMIATAAALHSAWAERHRASATCQWAA